MSIESVMPYDHLILCHPLLLPPSIFPSITVFSKESALHIRWPKDWSFSFNISPASEHSGLISFRMDWLHLLAVQGTFKSLLQHYSSKASILLHSAFFIVQRSHPYMTPGKTIAWVNPLWWFGRLWLFTIASARSHFSDYIYSLATVCPQTEKAGRRHGRSRTMESCSVRDTLSEQRFWNVMSSVHQHFPHI